MTSNASRRRSPLVTSPVYGGLDLPEGGEDEADCEIAVADQPVAAVQPARQAGRPQEQRRGENLGKRAERHRRRHRGGGAWRACWQPGQTVGPQ
jgi:hypothetical protein